MRKAVLILAAVMLLLILCSCGSAPAVTDDTAEEHTHEHVHVNSVEKGELFPYVLNTDDYELYQDIFYNDNTAYDNTTVTKTGTFAILDDQFNGVERYYVWGFADGERDGDFQWEFVPVSGSIIPEQGTLVEVTGTLTVSSDALDGRWIENASITVKESPSARPEKDALDCRFMSPTLEFVQLYSLHKDDETFDGHRVILYGRLLNEDILTHPYFDDSWEHEIEINGDAPELGTIVVADGVYEHGHLHEATLSYSAQYDVQ